MLPPDIEEPESRTHCPNCGSSLEHEFCMEPDEVGE